jgi:DNA-damage-inducible protein D
MSGDGQDTALEALEEQAEAQIRRVLHEGRWFFSVIDVIGLLTEAPKPRMYWADMKRRVETEGFTEVLAKCRQLKMMAADGKQRLTDAADTETMLRLIQSIPSPKAEPFKAWMARVGRERLEELENPALAVDRLRQLYKRRGYTDEWIDKRLQGIIVRDGLTQEWRERGADESREFAILTDILHRGTFDLPIEAHKAVKSLKKRDNLRDSMTSLELALTTLSEVAATTIHQARDSQGFTELQHNAHEAGEVGGAARKDIEARAGQPAVSAENFTTLTAPARQGRLFADAAQGAPANAQAADRQQGNTQTWDEA